MRGERDLRGGCGLARNPGQASLNTELNESQLIW